eukprot:CAMPEP_0119048762 /NCGR_PEP_ID=MMETSP1177-20130426/60921_1 /TAXON_ID=2985 /ORGANISM="Ochromonas sp, Strain CCMP1899" /LENGTH=332 /DNA_ID=CAMNT_0007025119 /DNA_START=736 /DNA_END=1734 /DNA_ORIENTATION=-
MITTISDSILVNKKLKTLDLSHNLLTDWEDVRKLVELPNLTNLGLKENKLPPPPESTDELEVREDKAAEGIEDKIERRYRRFVLSIFLKIVGVAKKSFEQLIVLDMKRVKMKLTPGMSADNENEVASKNPSPIGKNDTKSVSKNVIKKTVKTLDRQNSDDNNDIKKQGTSSKAKTVSNKRLLQHSDLGGEKEPSDKENDKKSKKNKKMKTEISSQEQEGFLNQNSNIIDKESLKKSIKPADITSGTGVGSGVLSVVIHKKDVKLNKIVKKKEDTTITDKTDNTKILLSKTESKIEDKKGNILKTGKIDNVSVTNVFAGDDAFVVGGGGNSAW